MASCLEKPVKTGRLAPKSGLFLHIFKCGGTSVANVMQRYDNLHVCHGPQFGGRLHQDVDAGHFEYGTAEASDFDACFTFIRHPFSRVAAIAAVMNSRRPEGCSVAHVLHVAEQPGVKLDRSRGLASDHEIWTHTRPISWYRLDDGQVLICHQEEMDTGWLAIRHYLGINDELPRLNKSPQHPQLTNRERDLAARIYREDLKYYA